MKTILCINGSDSMGRSGIQADIRTVRDLGALAVTAVTSVTAQNTWGIAEAFELPSSLVAGQVRAIYRETQPDAVKVGMLNDPTTIQLVRDEIVGCRRVVCSPVILSSYGGALMTNEAISAYCRHLLPLCTLLIVKCVDAEIVLGRRICTDDDMRQAALELQGMGAGYVLLRGGTYSQGRINALLSAPDGTHTFFTSANIEGWQRHGVGGTLAAAVATRLAQGDDPSMAVTRAHAYLHTQVVYAMTPSPSSPGNSHSRHYDRFMSLLAEHYAKAHHVAFYAEKMAITTRYLTIVTNSVGGSAPKQIIDNFVAEKAEGLLRSTDLTIQQVAYQLGFATQVAFARFFKAQRGCSPSEFRRAKSYT